MNMEIGVIIFLMSMAILLFVLEIFFIPGITVAGVGGLLFTVAGLYYAYSCSATTGHITLIVSLLVFFSLFIWLIRSNTLQRIALKTDVDSTVVSTRSLGLQVGEEGITLSRLAPIGKARFGQVVVEAKAEEDFLDEQTSVVIIRIEGYNVLVKELKEQKSTPVITNDDIN